MNATVDVNYGGGRVARFRDQIITTGGIMGEVVHVKDDELTVKSGESRLIIQRDRVAVVRSPGEREETDRK